ncbi:hypothetical protein DMENIID0001_161570 [Sergentomyia squamirostris]
MKLIASLLLISSLTVFYVAALPARYDPDDDAEVVVVPLERQKPKEDVDPNFGDNFDGVIEGEIPGGFFTIFRPLSFDFGSFFSGFEDTLRRWREQVANSWANRPDFDEEDVDDLDSKGNTTSTVQIIDGHKVIVNETTYVRKTDFGTSVFKHRTVDVQPLDEEGKDAEETTINPKAEATTKKNTDTERDIESTEVDNTENEVVNKGYDNDDENQELHDLVKPLIPIRPSYLDAPSSRHEAPKIYSSEHFPPARRSHDKKAWGDIVGFSSDPELFAKINRNEVRRIHPIRPPYDLSDDIAINEMLADQAIAASHRDAEIFRVDNNRPVDDKQKTIPKK